MKRIFVSLSYDNRSNLSEQIEVMKAVAHEFGYDLFVFVDAYDFPADAMNEMMETAFCEIRSSDVVIAEVTRKAIGVGIEIGYARGIGKPIIYMRHKDASYSTTAAGTATFEVMYGDVLDLADKLTALIQEHFA